MEVFNTPSNYPVIYQIELTERCNFNCPMCINDRIKDKQDASRELIDKIVDSGYLRNTLYTEFQFSGEPTIAKNLDYAIERVKSTGTMVGLSTNLSTIKQSGMVNTLNKLDCLTISLDVFHKETYEESRYPAKFESFLVNLGYALELLDNPLIQIQLLKTEWTKDVYEEAKEDLHEWLEMLRYFGNSNVIIREVEDCFVGYHDNGEAPVNNNMCLNPFLTVSIKADGTVVPCCFDFLKELPLGNIMEEDLLDIWQEKKEASYLRYLRGAHQAQGAYVDCDLPQKCQECYARSPIIFMQNELIPSLVRFKCKK